MILPRRKFLIGAAATLLAAPAIVRYASLMPVHVKHGFDFGRTIRIQMAVDQHILRFLVVAGENQLGNFRLGEATDPPDIRIMGLI